MTEFYAVDMLDEKMSEIADELDRPEYENIILEAQTILDSSPYPLVDISENDTSYILRAELPGFNKNDIEITYKNQVLSLKGERSANEDTKGSNLLSERFTGKFVRRFAFADAIATDKIRAQYRNGILKITLPKAESAKPKEISIRTK